jgi:hypothetical protein
VHLNQVKRFYELQGPVVTSTCLNAEEKDALKTANAEELENVPGHMHQNTDDKVAEPSAEPEEGIELDLATKHKYNLRKRVDHAFVSIRNRTNT